MRRTLFVLFALLIFGVVSAVPIPDADFYATPLTACVHEPIQFTDTSTNEPTVWHWTMGDGLHLYEQNPSYAYNETGVYTVSLKAGNVAGDDSETKIAYITIIDCNSRDDSVRWCGTSEIFLWNESSDGGVYRVLGRVPELAPESASVVTVSSANSPQHLGTFISPPNQPDAIGLAPGMWRFRTFHNVSSTVGVTTLEFHIYNHSESGVDTDLFYGHVITEDINSLTPEEYLYSYAKRNYTTFFPGDRLVIDIDATTTSTTPRDVYMILGDNVHTSMVQISYFVCDGLCCGSSACASGGSGESNIAKAPGFGIIVVLALVVALIVRKRK